MDFQWLRAMVNYPGCVTHESFILYCPKCNREFSRGETICPVDATPLVSTLTNSWIQEPLQSTRSKPLSQNAQPDPSRADPSSSPSTEMPNNISDQAQMKGPLLPPLADHHDDEDLQTILDAPMHLDSDHDRQERPTKEEPTVTRHTDSDGGDTASVATSGSQSTPEAFASTMHAMDQSVHEALPLGLKKIKSSVMIGRELHGTYRLLRMISEGPMSTIFEASHVRLTKKQLAIKMLNPSMETRQDAYARFRREAEIAAELGHPHIVDVLDFNITKDGHLYLVMEFLEGEDLDARLKKTRQLPFVDICQIMGQVGSGLQAAHDHEIIHRDMKPANIFLVKTTDNRITTKILDFGISKIKHSESVVTRYNMIVGTPFFMSPEQTLAMDVDHTTDVFALGSIAYQMLTGKLPFEAPTLPEILDKVKNHEPTSVTTLLPRATEDVHRIVFKALQKKKEDRYQRIEHFAKDLIAALHQIEPLSLALFKQLIPDQADGDHDFYFSLSPEKAHPARRRGLIGPTRPIPMLDLAKTINMGNSPQSPPRSSTPIFSNSTVAAKERASSPPAVDTAPETPAKSSKLTDEEKRLALSADAPASSVNNDTSPIQTLPDFASYESPESDLVDPRGTTMKDADQQAPPVDLVASPSDLAVSPQDSHPPVKPSKLASTAPDQLSADQALDLAAFLLQNDNLPDDPSLPPTIVETDPDDFEPSDPSEEIRILHNVDKRSDTRPEATIDFLPEDGSDPLHLSDDILVAESSPGKDSIPSSQRSKTVPITRKKNYTIWICMLIALILGGGVYVLLLRGSLF